MDRFKLKLDIYRDYDLKEAVTRMGPEREALSPPIDVDELFDEEHPLNAWVETRQERDVPEFDPRDYSWAEGELDGVEARDPELRKQNIREAKEKDKGMDKGDMKDNNIMQPMSGHLGSQTIVQGLLIYLHFSLPFYRTQILVAPLLEYKEDGYLGLHKNKSIVKQQIHTNHLAYGVQLHHNLEKAQLQARSLPLPQLAMKPGPPALPLFPRNWPCLRSSSRHVSCLATSLLPLASTQYGRTSPSPAAEPMGFGVAAVPRLQCRSANGHVIGLLEGGARVGQVVLLAELPHKRSNLPEMAPAQSWK
ncbi:hypothetical protein Taro_001669 [Colocasia esculenta]|uniref:Uncharacterized protein n=1 Tax=Colocasia esculenta TaxID=4460 RepID=A0A843TIV4_COLES|nr:hypothetical protein [Colocasia esculenta]